tara:strand:+ start:661 stop:1203 length:543 start_codon:yes stop_codon:yes gene_type:complete
MKIPKTCKLEKVVSKDESREALLSILIESKDGQTNAVATDGRRMAVVPIEIADEDQLDGQKLMFPKALIEARKQAKQAKESTIGLNGAAMMPNGEIYPIRTDLKYPNWRQVVPPNDNPRQTISFNAKYLFELAQAIGCPNDNVKLQIETNSATGQIDPRAALIIEEKTTGGKGILMPTRD